jgi:hypothetical protein
MIHLRDEERRRVIARWREDLENNPPATGIRVLEVVFPHLEEWIDCPWGGLSYRMTQMLIRHGCFREYLCRIGKKQTMHCHHCEGNRDSAQQTLVHCPALAEESGILIQEVDEDLSLAALASTMVFRKSAWKAVSSFCERVMSRKEKAERERERQAGGGVNRRKSPPEKDEDGGDDSSGDEWNPLGFGGGRTLAATEG